MSKLDRADKLSIYAREGVRHAWLLDLIARTLEVLRLEHERWVTLATFADDARVRAEPFDAIELELGTLWDGRTARAMRFYFDALAELGLAPLAAAPLDVRIHRALFCPTFHPHACVTVTQYQDLVELHVAVRDAPDLRVDIAPPSPPFDDTRHPTLDDPYARDGVALYGELSIAGALHTFSADNAEFGTPQRAYFLALLALARPHFPALAALAVYSSLKHDRI